MGKRLCELVLGCEVDGSWEPIAVQDGDAADPFENLQVWKRSARLSADIYRGMRDLTDWGFRDQITRAGLSIPSNIAEGYERESNKDLIKFLRP
jgi:hypothetical protein